MIDARLIAIYNEYLGNNQEAEFINMLYELLDSVTPDLRVNVAKDRRVQKMKETKAERKAAKQRFEAYLNAMTPEERIEFLKTPWEKMPDWIKDMGLVRFPEEFNFLRIAGIVSENERQKETFGCRLIRYMESHGFITSDEEGTKLHYDRFAEVCNNLAEKYDLAWRPGHKAQKTRITTSDLKGYTTKNITPKKDKLTAISVATGVPIAYLGGYCDNEPQKTGPIPDDFNPFGSVKFRKKRGRVA